MAKLEGARYFEERLRRNRSGESLIDYAFLSVVCEGQVDLATMTVYPDGITNRNRP